ncbi:MAG: aminotransferase class I/II-fold pyridoxal phosphate-dependent enzyme, partial [Eubacteriales bacterium]|nr:aminotransferase class I/II-fold pyridoxal phosphate-dependent enzyme [Clostridiales bacterium]MDD7300799.1 aminotransferase class I/II-fold pyridoxal phosphate-dependent enzyme [Eubacteriales bacterium]
MLDYAKILSENVQEIKPSGIRKFFDLLGDRKDVISLTVGEPDFMTPYHIREAGIESLEKGRTFYTSNNGILELRREICNYLNRRFGLAYEPKSEVIVTVGGSEAIDLTVRALIEPGDEAIIPVPSFVCYGPIVELAHGKPVFIETKEEDSFKLRPEALRAAITPKTKLLILPYPNNPTGAVMTKDELEEIAQILEGTNIMVLSDEIYGELTYGRRHTAFATVGNMWERTITVSGFSKAYAMTGWRLGYLCAPKELVTQMHKIHQYAIMCAPTTSQLAAIEALKHGDPDIEMMANEYNRRRKYILDGLRKMGIDTFEAEGAFYVFPRIGKFGLSSDDFCQKLLDEKGVAIVPGNAFGDCGEGYARISYAYSVEHITEA